MKNIIMAAIVIILSLVLSGSIVPARNEPGYNIPRYRVEVDSNMDISTITLDIKSSTARVTMESDTVMIVFKDKLDTSKIDRLCVEMEEECIRIMKARGMIE